ncbi:MAG TPA: hypothetical protein VIV15_06225, partial [Anaerolineales bacterium]
SRTDPDGIVGKSLQKDIDLTNEHYHSQAKRREELIKEIGARRFTDEKLRQARRTREDLALGLKNKTTEDMREMFELVDLKVTVRNGKPDFDCAIPEETVSLDSESLPTPG